LLELVPFGLLDLDAEVALDLVAADDGVGALDDVARLRIQPTKEGQSLEELIVWHAMHVKKTSKCQLLSVVSVHLKTAGTPAGWRRSIAQ
jgi:hypothetical protein